MMKYIILLTVVILSSIIIGTQLFGISQQSEEYYEVYVADWDSFWCVPYKSSVVITKEFYETGRIYCPDREAFENSEYKYIRTSSNCEVWINVADPGLQASLSTTSFSIYTSNPERSPLMLEKFECAPPFYCDFDRDLKLGVLAPGDYYEIKDAYTTRGCGFLGLLPCKLSIHITEKTTPFHIIDTQTYKEITTLEQGCCPPGDILAFTKKEDFDAIKDQENCLPEYKPLPYISSYKKILLHGTKNTHPIYGLGICQGSIFYPIEEIVMADGSKKILKQSTTGYSVDCCPNTPGCNSNFEKTEEWYEPNDECDERFFIETDWVPVSGGYVVKYKCEDGKIVEADRKKNNCLNLGINEICDENYEPIKVGEYERSRTGGGIDSIFNIQHFVDMAIAGIFVLIGIFTIILVVVVLILIIRG